MYARSLSRIALVFVGLYVLQVVSVAIPVKLFDYLWISKVTVNLINGSSFPLLALLTLVVGSLFYENDHFLKSRRQLFCRLAGVAAIGFILLIPLNFYTGILQHTKNTEKLRALDTAESQLASYRKAATQATSMADLQSRLAKINAPKLAAADLALPLPELKARMTTVFDQVSMQIAERRLKYDRSTNWQIRGTEILRSAIACLLLAFGFAAFAQRNSTDPVLMDSFEETLVSLARSLRPLLRPRQYLRNLHLGKLDLRSPRKTLATLLKPPAKQRRLRKRRRSSSSSSSGSGSSSSSGSGTLE
jgi:hypothetical protein